MKLLKLINQGLGESFGSPFPSPRLFGLDDAGAALIGGIGSSLLGGIFGGSSTSKTNKMNYRINKENNEFNAQQAKLQREWQEDMIQQDREYNTASAQVQRLREAGLNPSLALGNVSSGAATSAPSGATASSAGSATMQSNSQVIQQMFSSMAHSFTEAAQVETLKNQASKTAAETLSILQRTAQDKELFPDQKRLLREQINSLVSGIQKNNREIDNLKTIDDMNFHLANSAYYQSRENYFRSKEAEESFKYMPQRVRLDFQTQSQMLCNLMDQGKLTRAQTHAALVSAYLDKLQAAGVRIDNETRSEANKAANDLTRWSAREKERRAKGKKLSAQGSFFGHSAGIGYENE